MRRRGQISATGKQRSRISARISTRIAARLSSVTIPKKSRLARGFTLLELMIVISIIMILMAVAVPMYNQAIVQARESVLRSNLNTLRSVIQQYTLDKQKAPQGLDDLVQAGYLRQVPVDPMTRETNWEVVQEDVLLAVDQQDPGITDVHSASNATASDGTAYSTW
jgi:general secretion pathway protein G